MSSKKRPDENMDYNDRYIYSSSSMDNKNKVMQSRAKKIRNKKIILSFAIIFSIVVGLLGGTFIYAYKMLDSLNYQPLENDNNNTEYIPGANKDPMILNVALFGVDRHAESDVRSRSDSIVILSLDSRHKKIKLTSLMRDMWIHIPGYKDNRINAAIALGGEQLAIKTIEQNFGIKIDRFCSVDFEGFKDIIDIIGGLDIDITKQEAHHINRLLIELDIALKKGGLKPFNSPLLEEFNGVHHLNGAQSLQYARSRKVPTAEGMHDDYARTFRQRRVISLVVDKLKTSSLPQLLNIIEKVAPYINTNFKKNEIITLSKDSPKYLQYEISEFRLPENDNLEGRNINGASVLVIKDMNKAKLNLAKFIYEDSVKESSKKSISTKESNNVSQPVQNPKEKVSNSSSTNSSTTNTTKAPRATTNKKPKANTSKTPSSSTTNKSTNPNSNKAQTASTAKNTSANSSKAPNASTTIKSSKSSNSPEPKKASNKSSDVKLITRQRTAKNTTSH